jgi:hypothetical protein
MRILLTWIGAILITGIIISPFFWLWFLKKRNKLLYIIISSLISIIIFIFYGFHGYDLLLNFTSKLSTDAYYVIYEAGSWAPFIYFFLMIISPFIFTKILYGKFSLKSVIISIFCSIAIFIAIALIFTYYIFPMAGEVLLKNI